MNDPCPVCGLVIEREEGYFLGAMYFSYFLGVIVLGAGYFLAKWRFPAWNDYAIIAGLVVLYVPLMPVVFRYGRTAWIYFDRWAWPLESGQTRKG